MSKQTMDRSLEIGIEKGNEEMITLALDNGANPDILLFAGVGAKDGDWVRTAIARGANVSMTWYGNMAFAAGDHHFPLVFYAHKNFERNIFDLLLAQKPEMIALVDPVHKTLLQRAVDKSDEDKALYYLSKGADPEQATLWYKSPLEKVQGGALSKDRRSEVLIDMMKRIKDGKCIKENKPAPVKTEETLKAEFDDAAAISEKITGGEQIVTTGMRDKKLPHGGDTLKM